MSPDNIHSGQPAKASKKHRAQRLMLVFNALKANPYTTNDELASLLKVKEKSVCQYRYRLKKLLSTYNSTLAHSSQFRRRGALFTSVLSRICLECFGDAFTTDREIGEKVCTSCGYVAEYVPERSKDLPSTQPMH